MLDVSHITVVHSVTLDTLLGVGHNHNICRDGKMVFFRAHCISIKLKTLFTFTGCEFS